MSRVPAPLLTADARDLRLLARPPWQRRLVAWSLPGATLVLAVVHTAAVELPVCTAATPCRPDVAGSVFVGLLFASAACGFILPRLAPWLAATFLAAEVVAERVLRVSQPSPVWAYVIDAAYVGLCVVIAGVNRERRPTARAAQWLAGVRRERPPAPTGADLPRPGRRWRWSAVILLGLGAAVLAWGWSAQQRADAQQHTADRTSAEVTSIPDELSIVVAIPGGEAVTIDVLDVHQYAVGERIDLYVDDEGLRQPVAEPYDASGWHLLGVFLVACGVAGRLRGGDERRRFGRLFVDEQPVTEVTVLPGRRVVAVYAGDARPGEPAIAQIRTDGITVVATEDGRARVLGLDVEIGPQPASLYGVPAPGQWCTVSVRGRAVVPSRPLPTTVEAPPYGFDTGRLADVDVEDTDAVRQALSAAMPAEPALRQEDLAALRPGDLDPDPSQVRVHVRHPAAGYASAVGTPLIFVSLAGILPALSYGVALVVAGVAVAIASALAWRLFMRGRIAWNRRGLAVVGALGVKRGPWRMVRSIEHGSDHVTIHTGYSSLVVGAGPFLGVFGRGGRTALELANALRHARGEAPFAGQTEVVTGGDIAADLDLPPLVTPRPPVGLLLLWLVYTPLLAWVMQVFSSG